MEKKKVSYSLVQNVWYALRHMWKWNKGDMIWSLLAIPFSVGISILETYMASDVVRIVTEHGTPQELAYTVLLFSAGMLALYALNNKALNNTQAGMLAASDQVNILYEKRFMEIDYEMLEHPDFQMIAEKARESADSHGNVMGRMMQQFLRFCSAVLGVVFYGVVLAELTPWLIVIMAVISTAGYFTYGSNHRWERRNRGKWAAESKRLWYSFDKFRDTQSAQDIILYHMLPWLGKIFRKDLNAQYKWLKYRQIRWKLVDTIFAFMTMARDFLSYGILIWKVCTGGMSAAEFVFYFNAMRQFIRWLLELYDGMDMSRFSSYEFCDFRDYMDYDDSAFEWGDRPAPEEACEIQFSNVEYAYPGKEEAALSGIHFTIRKGEKVAVVGPNGAGKTTLVKLMCGLYRPTKGQVSAGGRDVREYARDSYYSLFSAVFQDIAYLPCSIAENIAMCREDEIDDKRLADAIELSGLGNKIKKLPEGSSTMLVKKIREGAVNLSGGEKQKLALARALYKDGKIMILDEPTAALDPIAESEIYQKYNELAEGRTAVFISHRLASTRFCDRIFYVEQGRILEEGTHEELLALGGKYAEMYQVQSQYYQEEGREQEDFDGEESAEDE